MGTDVVSVIYLGPPRTVPVPDGLPATNVPPDMMLAYFDGHWALLPLGAAPPVGKTWVTVDDPTGANRTIVVEAPGYTVRMIPRTQPTPAVVDGQPVLTRVTMPAATAARLAVGVAVERAVEAIIRSGQPMNPYQYLHDHPDVAIAAVQRFDPTGRFVWDPVLGGVLDTQTGEVTVSATG